MRVPRLHQILLLTIVMVMFCGDMRSYAAERSPNIILILLDDLGKEWIGCYGASDIDTPHIDALASQGMKFENAYSMPQCTPTRACLLTGQYPYRNGWINHWDVPRWGRGCHFDPRHNLTFARLLREHGYRTCIAGKWQINDFRDDPAILQKHGFDAYCMWTGYERGNPPSDKRYWNPYIHTSEGSRTYSDRFGPDVYSDFIVDFMKANREHPMLVYFPMCLPHGPLTDTPADPGITVPLMKHKAMVRYIDLITEKLVTTVNDLGLSNDTIIIWTTDNGTSGRMRGKINGREIRGAKGRSNEPGVCQPFIVWGPGRVPANVTTDALVDVSDLFPTFLELAGIPIPREVTLDGQSFAPLITGQAQDSPRSWIMAMGGQAGRFDEDSQRVAPVFEYRDRVIRNKRYKLGIDTSRRAVTLFDLKKDPAEQDNLIDSTLPEVIAAKESLLRVAETFPEKDAWPRYDPVEPLKDNQPKP